MWKRVLITLFTLSFAFGILLISVFRTASTKYKFNPTEPAKFDVLGDKSPKINYDLPFPGKVLPDSPLWPLKALRDKVWIMVNTNPSREAELKLLFADKRLGAAKILFDQGKPEIGISTLTKAEKYLEEAGVLEKQNRERGYDTTDFLFKIANSSLEHFEVIEYMLTKAPDNAKPSLLEAQKYSQKVYEDAHNLLLDKSKTPPENPFNW